MKGAERDRLIAHAKERLASFRNGNNDDHVVAVSNDKYDRSSSQIPRFDVKKKKKKKKNMIESTDTTTLVMPNVESVSVSSSDAILPLDMTSDYEATKVATSVRRDSTVSNGFHNNSNNSISPGGGLERLKELQQRLDKFTVSSQSVDVVYPVKGSPRKSPVVAVDVGYLKLQLQTAEATLVEKTARIDELVNELTTLRRTVTELRSCNASLQNNVNHERLESSKFKQLSEGIEEHAKTTEYQVSKLQKLNEEVEKRAKVSEVEVLKLRKLNQDMEHRAKTAESRVQTLEAMNISSDHRDIERKMELALRRNEQLQSFLADRNARVSSLEADLKVVENGRCADDVAAAKLENEAMNVHLRQELETARAEALQARSDVAKLTKDLTETRDACTEVEKALSIKSQHIDEIVTAAVAAASITNPECSDDKRSSGDIEMISELTKQLEDRESDLSRVNSECVGLRNQIATMAATKIANSLTNGGDVGQVGDAQVMAVQLKEKNDLISHLNRKLNSLRDELRIEKESLIDRNEADRLRDETHSLQRYVNTLKEERLQLQDTILELREEHSKIPLINKASTGGDMSEAGDKENIIGEGSSSATLIENLRTRMNIIQQENDGLKATVKAYEDRLMSLTEEKLLATTNLDSEKHITAQLAQETETIADYISLYQDQRRKMTVEVESIQSEVLRLRETNSRLVAHINSVPSDNAIDLAAASESSSSRLRPCPYVPILEEVPPYGSVVIV